MRFGFRLLGLICIVVLSVATMVILLGSAGGAELVESDDFSGNDGDLPDDTMWTVQETQSNDLVEIRSNQLRTYMVDAGRAGVIGVDEHDLEHFTIIVEWRWISGQGRAGEVIVHQNKSGTWLSMFNLWYDVAYHGWGYGTRSGGSTSSISTFNRNVLNGEWYTWNITFDVDHVNMTVKRNSNGNTIFSRTNLAADTPTGDIRVTLTTFGINVLDADCRWDNYKLYDNAATPNVRPRWLELPNLTAIEDIPLVYDLSSNVTDPDGPLENLVITSNSPYVTAIDGLEVTFEFPNGVLTATVPLVLSDGFVQVTGDVNFTITPVNDPPEQDVPTRYEAAEEVPLTVDFEPYIWDIDNDTSELFLLVDDIYSSVEGLELTVEYPEGVTTHEVLVHISDGLLSTSVWLNFTVVPVDDPPTIDDLGELEVVEDQERTFNITPFLHDIDTPVEDLVLIVRNRNCTIDGQDLFLMYTKGGIDDIVTIEVTDGHTLVSGDLLVHVVEVNDPPIAHKPSPKGFTEGEAKTVDLSAYIEDEDTPRAQLTLECDHPAVVSIDGLNITFLYDEWVEQHDVEFSVFDGALRDNSSFMVQVIAVNDDPVILGIGDLESPYVIRIDEGTTEWFTIEVYDEDGNDFRYDLESEWEGIEAFANGTIKVTAEWGVIGEYDANLLVIDDDRGSAEVDIHVVVVNINDPPTLPVIIKPINDTSFERETNVTFEVDFADPDIVHGQVLTVTWSSNLSGAFKELTSDDEMSFIWNSLPVGEHKVTVSITDGEFTRSAWVKLSVIEPYTPPPPDNDEEGGLLTGSIPMLALLVIILLVIVVAALFVSRNRGDGERAATPPPTTEEQVTVDVHGSLEEGTGPPTHKEGYQMPSSGHGHDQMSVSSEPLVGQPLEQIAPLPGTPSEDPLPEVPSTDAEDTASLSEEERLRKLERLEERLLDGAISEETYRELKAKYGG